MELSEKEIRIKFLIDYNIDQMTQFLVEDFNLDIASALDVIYDSQLYAKLQDKDTELYVQSPGYLYDILKKEKHL